MENKKILIYGELKNNVVESSAKELMTKARELFPAQDMEMAFVTCGTDIKEAVTELSKINADKVYWLESNKLTMFHIDYYSAVIKAAIDRFQPDIVLIPASAYGEELAPTLSLQCKSAGAAHCVDLKVDDEGNFIAMVPAFGGKVIGEILIPSTKPQIASVKPGIFTAKEQPARECRIIELEQEIIHSVSTKIIPLGIHQQEQKGIPVEAADVVVCGGFGVGSQENWDKLETLAAKLNGTTGCTRPVLDEGWVTDEGKMIGTSGKGIRPKICLGFGISGASHHQCGMKDSGMIINVNQYAHAPSFDASDYCVVADNMDIVEALLEKL